MSANLAGELEILPIKHRHSLSYIVFALTLAYYLSLHAIAVILSKVLHKANACLAKFKHSVIFKL